VTSRLSEATVREEIIAPILRRLGTEYEHSAPEPNLPPLRVITISITGSLQAYWQAHAPDSPIQRLIERLGLTRIQAFSSSNENCLIDRALQLPLTAK